MQTTFSGKKISAILGVLPEKEAFFEDEVGNYSFSEKQTLRLKKVMGYEKHRISKDTSTVSDFGIFGIRHMLEEGWIQKEDIGAVIVVGLCPDYFVPHNSNIIQGELGLDSDVMCMDIAQGCCGFLLGLFQSFMLLEQLGDKKVLLVNGDVLSHKVSKHDRNDFPLVGDAATITVVENTDDDAEIYYEMHMDGSRRDVLKIPAGGFKMPSTPETGEMKDIGDGNVKSLDHMHMDGNSVFNFVQVEVPPLIEHALKETGQTIEDIDWFLFHQPNKFMLQKLAQKLGVPFEKMPMNLVESYGNPSGASIPLVAIHNLKEQLLREKCKCCFSAFGSGLAWGVMIADFGDLDYCDMIVSDL
jgi:3-oxoacyl-[acyl-carrier-protein] synthase-3